MYDSPVSQALSSPVVSVTAVVLNLTFVLSPLIRTKSPSVEKRRVKGEKKEKTSGGGGGGGRREGQEGGSDHAR